MEKAKHTPGPWQVKNDYDERHIVIANIDGETFTDGTSSYSYDFVCDTYGDGDDDSRSMAVANANARLIAAAPDMYGELDVRVGDLVMLRKAIEAGDPRNELFVRIDDMLRETRAALAKAGA